MIHNPVGSRLHKKTLKSKTKVAPHGWSRQPRTVCARAATLYGLGKMVISCPAVRAADARSGPYPLELMTFNELFSRLSCPAKSKPINQCSVD